MERSKEQAIGSIEVSTMAGHLDTTYSAVLKDENVRASDFPQNLLDDLSREGLAITDDGIVGWTDRSALHPSRWPLKRKLFDTSVILFYEFFTTLISNCGALSAIGSYKELNMNLVSATCAFMSTYQAAQAIGCLVFPPYTEVYGRKTTYVVSSLLYGISNVVVGNPGNLTSIILGRCLSGFLSSIPTVVTSGSIEDMWSSHDRIWAIQGWVSAALLGVAIAPAISQAIDTSYLGWRWVYHLAAIVLGFTTLLFLLILESRPSRVLQNKVEQLKKTHSFVGISVHHLEHTPDLRNFARTSLLKPIQMFLTELIVIAITIMGATVYASAYLLTDIIPSIYVGFHFSLRESGLVFLALGIGAITFPILTRLYDIRIGNKRKRQQQMLEPEDKLFGFFLAAPAQAIAIWWFAWTVPPHFTHSPLISIAALMPLGFAINEFDYVLIGYLCDTYTTDAGSANAPMNLVRAVLIAVYPLFGPSIYKSLGNNVASSILAAVATGYCFVALAFWKYGIKLRERSSWVRRTQEIQRSI